MPLPYVSVPKAITNRLASDTITKLHIVGAEASVNQYATEFCVFEFVLDNTWATLYVLGFVSTTQ